ncbi:MAG: hypothetical protein ACR2KX_15015 [Chitinophagaceae bacterium]
MQNEAKFNIGLFNEGSSAHRLPDKNGKQGEGFVQGFCAGFVMDSGNRR